MLCDYGCGQEAIYQFKNGKWCCSSNWRSCINSRMRYSAVQKIVQDRSEVKEKKSVSLKGKPKSEKHKKRISEAKKGKVGPNLGRKFGPHTEEWKKQHSEDMKGEKNPNKRPEARERFSRDNPMKRPEVSRKAAKSLKIFLENHPEERERRGKRIEGENNPNWNPNREEVIGLYTEKFYEPVYREQIKREQDYVDPITSKKLTKRACLHHIDYNKQNDIRENLIWLNLTIHAKTNFNKEKWQNLLQELNKNIIQGRLNLEGKECSV